jgi:hypothetical protein
MGSVNDPLVVLLIGLIGVVFFMLTSREHFMGLPDAVNVGGPDYANTKPGGAGQEIYSTTPNTCRPNKPSQEAGLCYQSCKPGFHGAVTMCVADSQNIGVGTPIGLEPCPNGFNTEGLICREPLTGGNCRTWWDGCASRLPGWMGGGCMGGAKTQCEPIRGGRLKGRLDNGGVCPGPGGGDDHVDRVDGLCYKKCPKELPVHIPGMPYLCYKGGPLTYDRGVGDIPALVRLFKSYYF